MAKHSTRKAILVATIVAMLMAGAPRAQVPLGTAITYQGQFTDAGAPANGSYDLQFTLFDAATAGAAISTVLTLDSVTVTAGVFTVSLDFGSGAFGGDARWVETGVRPGGTSGPFLTLTPRHALLPAAQALYAVSAGTAASATTAVTATTATTANSAATAVVATTALSATTAIQLAGQPGAFYLDLANHSGTLGLAQGGTGATSVATAPFLPKTVGGCAVGGSIQAINGDGTVVCAINAPRAGSAWATLESVGNVGQFTSITTGPDGLGLISYYDATNGNLKVARCAGVPCSSLSAAPATVDSTGVVGQYTSITIGADGLGLISYFDATNNDLKVAHCTTASCSTATVASLDAAGAIGQFTSITIGVDGLGLISYYDATNGDLKVVHCANAACNVTSAAPATLDSIGLVGQFTSITIGADGLGLVSYYDGTNGALKVAHCTNVACSTATLSTLDSAGTVGLYTSTAIGADGLGLISYYDSTDGALKVAHCTNVACSTATLSTLDSGGSVGPYSSIAIGADGLGLVSYYDSTNGDLKAAHCANSACSSATLVTLDSGGSVGQYASITIGGDGLGLISYWSSTSTDLKVTHCGNTLCSPFVVRRR